MFFFSRHRGSLPVLPLLLASFFCQFLSCGSAAARYVCLDFSRLPPRRLGDAKPLSLHSFLFKLRHLSILSTGNFPRFLKFFVSRRGGWLVGGGGGISPPFFFSLFPVLRPPRPVFPRVCFHGLKLLAAFIATLGRSRSPSLPGLCADRNFLRGLFRLPLFLQVARARAQREVPIASPPLQLFGGGPCVNVTPPHLIRSRQLRALCAVARPVRIPLFYLFLFSRPKTQRGNPPHEYAELDKFSRWISFRHFSFFFFISITSESDGFD